MSIATGVRIKDLEDKVDLMVMELRFLRGRVADLADAMPRKRGPRRKDYEKQSTG